MQKSEEKRKISRSGRYVTISPLFFSYFPPIFLLLFLLLLLHFSGTEEARAKNGSGLGLRKTRKGGWMEGTGQNDAVLTCFFHPAPFSGLSQPETTAIFCPSLFRAGEVKKKKKKKKKNRGKIGEK